MSFVITNLLTPKIKAWAWTFLLWLSLSIPGADIPLPALRFDKLVHFSLFFVFAWLWLDTKWEKINILKVSVAVLMIGLFSEVYQGLLPWERIPDPFDSLANILGGNLAVFMYVSRKNRKSMKLSNKEVE